MLPYFRIVSNNSNPPVFWRKHLKYDIERVYEYEHFYTSEVIQKVSTIDEGREVIDAILSMRNIWKEVSREVVYTSGR